MYYIQTTDGDLIASFSREDHMEDFYKVLTQSKEPEYLTMDLVMLHGEYHKKSSN